MNFCRRCGTLLNLDTSGAYRCEKGHVLYVNAAPAAGVFFVTQDNQILLSVRGIEPFIGRLDSFGGFIDEQETAEDALTRELVEELGLTSDQYEPPVFLSTETGYYPYDNESRSILSIFFWSRLRLNANPIPADDVAEIKTIPLAKVNLAQMDNIDVRKAVQKLQKIIL